MSETGHTLIPLSAPHLRGNELKYVTECIESEWVSSAGTFVNRFEEAVARAVGVEDAVACVNGTAALHIALLLAGVQPGDEVIVPTLTFIAPVNAVRYVGADPLFMDCDAHLNIDATKVEEFLQTQCERTPKGLINRTSGRRIGAAIAVHVYGHPADLQTLDRVTHACGLPLIEDATESLGSRYIDAGQARWTGTVGDFGCFSFNGNKLVTTGGGGMLLARDAGQLARARYLTTQAKDDSLYFRHDAVGYNYRLSNLQAAVGLAQMERLGDFIAIKRKNFARYREALAHLPGLSWIEEPAGTHSNYWHYALVVEDARGKPRRDALLQHLHECQIECRPLWRLNHRQKPYAQCTAYRIEQALHFEARILNIPCSVGLMDQQCERTIEEIRRFYTTNIV